MAKKVERVSLGYTPRRWQYECHKARVRFTVMALHRRAGKTELGVVELLDSALRSKLPQPLFVYMAPFLKQAKAIAWERLKHYARLIPDAEVNESELWVRLPGQAAKIQIFGGDNPDGLRGLRLDGVVIDEVAQIKPEVWNEIVQPALSEGMGRRRQDEPSVLTCGRSQVSQRGCWAGGGGAGPWVWVLKWASATGWSPLRLRALRSSCWLVAWLQALSGRLAAAASLAWC